MVEPGGLVPAHVLRTARALADSTPFYAFVSTTAVYQDWRRPGTDESAATWPGRADEDGDPADLAQLGPRKRGCELAVEQTYGVGASLIARAGMIVGPHDNVGYLPWWLTRIAEGGRLIAPGDSANLVWIDQDFLLSQGVHPWAELPLWIPDGPDTVGFWAVSGAKAQAAGLRSRPVAESVRDTWAWLRSGGEVRPVAGAMPIGLDRRKEQRVLAAWDAN